MRPATSRGSPGATARSAPSCRASRIDPKTLKVTSGSDLIDPGVRYWDYPNGSYVTSGARFADMTAQQASFGRFCSATCRTRACSTTTTPIAATRASSSSATKRTATSAAPSAITTDGARPAAALWPVLVGEHGPGRQPKRHDPGHGPGGRPRRRQPAVGLRRDQEDESGSAVDQGRADQRPRLRLDAVDRRSPTTPSGGRRTPRARRGRSRLVEQSWNLPGAVQNTQAKADGLSLNRVEDGDWDPHNPNDFYFVTTEGGQKTGTEARLSATVAGSGACASPTSRGPARRDADAAPRRVASHSVPPSPSSTSRTTWASTRHGNLLIQEDPGGNGTTSPGSSRTGSGTAPSASSPGSIRRSSRPARPGTRSASRSTRSRAGSSTPRSSLAKERSCSMPRSTPPKNLPAGTGPGTVQEFVENGQLLILEVDDWSTIYVNAD